MGRMKTVVPIGEPGMTVYEILNVFFEILLIYQYVEEFMQNHLKYITVVGRKSFDV